MGGKKLSFVFVSTFGTQKEPVVPTEQVAEWTPQPEWKLREKLQTITGIKPLPLGLCVSLSTELTEFILYKYVCWNNKPANGQVILARRGQRLLMEDSASSSRAWMARSCLPSWWTDINVFSFRFISLYSIKLNRN